MPSMHMSRTRRWLYQSPPVERAITQVRELLIGALRQGPIPRHIAFVMDGNRRFARSHGIETVEGHNLGFEALARILEVCYKTGVKVVTIYAFSIENFKRSKHEVDALMDMAKIKLLQLSQHGDLLDRYGASVRVLGQRALLNQDVLEAIDKAETMTQNNKEAVLNVCFPYTSQDEICAAIQGVVDEWSQPLPSKEPSPIRRPSFSEKHIEHTLRSRKMSTSTLTPLRETSPSGASDADTTSSITQQASSPGTSLTATSSATDLGLDPSNSEFDLLKPPAHTYHQQTNPIDLPLPLSRSSSPSRDLHPSAEAVLARSRSPSPTPPQNPAERPSPFSSTSSPSPSEKYPDPEFITSSTLTSHMFTADMPPLDLLVRTSGVERLSDFMLWQCHEKTEIVFLKCLWPEFDLWTFMPVLVEWQWRRKKIVEGGWGAAAGAAAGGS